MQRLSSTFDAVLDFVREWWLLLALGVLTLVLVGALVYGLTHPQRDPNCHLTGNTRTQWVLSGKVLVPIIQHEYVCTYTEWH